MQAIIDFLNQFLTKFVDSFKVKNPFVFTVIAVVLGAAYFIFESLMSAALPDGTSLLSGRWDMILEKAQMALLFVLTLLGAHTPSSRLKE